MMPVQTRSHGLLPVAALAIALALSPLPAAAASPQAYDFTGSYVAEVVADDDEEETLLEDEDVTASAADEIALLAQDGATARMLGGALSKFGNGTDEAACAAYGVNSIVLAVGEDALALLGDVSAKSSAKGANGLFATDSGTLFASGASVSTTAGAARGIVATYGGTAVGDGLSVQTKGAGSAVLAAGPGGGGVSVVNSTLEAGGADAPLIAASGTVEVENVQASGVSALVRIDGPHAVLVSNSRLASSAADAMTGDSVAAGITLYQSGESEEASASAEPAFFQANGSVLSSSIASGAFFHFTNTTADVVLANTTLDFDSNSAKLVQASGTTEAGGWGTAGKNGAKVSFTGIGERLAGDVEADSISSLDLYLLEGTTWKGGASVVANTAAGSGSSTNDSTGDTLTVNIDATSGWTVAGDSTVTNLNIAAGGSLVDAEGKAVKIVDADGNTIVDGASSVKVTVSGSFTTAVKTGDANRLREASIERDGFDEEFGTETAFGQNGSAVALSDEERARAASSQVRAWFHTLLDVA